MIELGLQASELTVTSGGCQPCTVILPPVADMVLAVPSGITPTAPPRERDTDGPLVAVASVTFTAATTPLPITFEFMATARHVMNPVPELQLMVLPAEARADPAVMLTAATSPAGYEIVHCKPAGAVEALKDRFNDTDPP
jgi:hypothetical protein